MTKKQAIAIICRCAKTYHTYLENNQILFVYRDSNNHSHYTEVQFKPHNFLHFTGVKLRKDLNVNTFYRYAINSRLNENDFYFDNSSVSELKLQVLDTIMNIDTRARMIGNYNNSKVDLYTEKVAGTVSACLGLIQKGNDNIFIPNSVLNEDIRTLIPKPHGKIYAIFKKKIGESYYTKLTYQKNKLEITRKCLPKELLSQITPTLLEDDNEKISPHIP